MKSVLMVVYSLPSQKNNKAGRVADFMNLLRDYGWEPVLLTHGAVSDTPENREFETPEGIDIIGTKPWDPAGLPRLIQSVLRYPLQFLMPDRLRLWALFSMKKASRIAKNKGVDLVYTVSPPMSTHLIGLKLKKKQPGLPWVADMTPAGCNEQPDVGKQESAAHSAASFKERYEKKLLARITDNADYIISNEPDIHVQELSELFEKACRATAAKKLENV